MAPDRSSLFRRIPSVDRVLADPEFERAVAAFPRPVVVEAVRAVLDRTRDELRRGEGPPEADLANPSYYAGAVAAEAGLLVRPSLRRVINATGIIIHTNLGRAPVSPDAFDRARDIALRYTNLEFDLESGARGSRYVHAEGLLRRLTGAEAALVTNNNAAAVLVALHALAKGKEVVVSRGELIEIGGSFRLPDIMTASGAKLVEVGTTNRTRAEDYRAAITGETALLMKAHLSNFRLEGFTEDVSPAELAAVGAERNVPVLYDLGSGAFVKIGPKGEPTVGDELRSGAAVITMSGDKLLGAVQAGIILGRRAEIERIRKCPMLRAVRVDKVTLALLEATLLAYLDPESVADRVPVLRLILRPLHDIQDDAVALRRALLERVPSGVEAEITEGESEAGGGAIGQPPIPTTLLRIAAESSTAEEIAARLRGDDPPVIVRVKHDRVLVDPRTLFPEEIPIVAEALARAVSPRREGGGTK